MKKLLSMFSGLLALTAVTSAAEPNVKVIPKSCPNKTYFKGFFMGITLGGSYNYTSGTGKKITTVTSGKPTGISTSDETGKIFGTMLPSLGARIGYNFAPTKNLRIGLETDGLPLITPVARFGFVTGKHHMYAGVGYNLWLHGFYWLADYSGKKNPEFKKHKLESDGFTNWLVRLGYDYAINEHSSFGVYLTYSNIALKSSDTATIPEHPMVVRITSDKIEVGDIAAAKATNHQVAVNLTYTRYF